MPNRAKEAVGIVRGVIDRVSDLEQQVSSDQGIPNLVRSISEELSISDSVTTSTTTVDRFTWGQDNWDDGSKQWG